MKRRIVALLSALLLSCILGLFAQGTPDSAKRHIVRVSLIKVIAHPEDFDGQRVGIVGYLGRNGLDRAVGVYVSEVDGRNFVLSNSVDLHLEDSQAKALTGKYVAFTGTYHASNPRSGNNGYIDQILDMRPWAGDRSSK